MGRRLRKGLVICILCFAALPPVLLLVFRFLPPPITPLMIIRLSEGASLHKTWRPLSEISPWLAQSVIASEDNWFCRHHGFDLRALQTATENWMDGHEAGGGSTISQQTAKNLFLWPGRSLLRKGLEAYATVWMEVLWSKERILEVYLNIAEWGPGFYGAEQAAQHYFHRPAARLSRQQAALLASILPNPRHWTPHSAFVVRHARTIERRLPQLGTLLDCSRPDSR